MPLKNYNKAGTIAEWVRASVLSHSEWMVLSSNPGGGRIIYLFHSRVGDGELSITRIDGYVTSNNDCQMNCM